MRALRIAVVIAIVLFLALTPGWLLEHLSRDQEEDFFTKPTPAWNGRIELWHIAEFRTYQGSVTDFLQDRADRYWKKKDRGVHIDVIGLTVEQYQDRIARGLTPDAYSFPSGFLYPEALQSFPVDTATLKTGLSPARFQDQVYAVPILMSGYFLVGNVQLLSANGFLMPEEGSLDPAVLQAALDLKQKVPQLYMPPILAARLNLTGQLAAWEQFQKGKVMLAVVDARTLGDLNRSASGNLLVESVTFPGYTDQVLYLGAAKGADAHQVKALSDFAAYLLTEEQQQRLTNLGALPTVQLSQAPVYAEESLDSLYTAAAAFTLPEPFAYQRYKEALTEDALRALTGDPLGKSSFWERMTVVESGIL